MLSAAFDQEHVECCCYCSNLPAVPSSLFCGACLLDTSMSLTLSQMFQSTIHVQCKLFLEMCYVHGLSKSLAPY
jgi:hypothetical protein